MLLKGFAWLGIILESAFTDCQYLSRPDLSPPKLNITVPALSETESGFIFVAPKKAAELYENLAMQAAPYIYRDDGELVWSGMGYYCGYVINFGVMELNGEPALRAFQGSMDGSRLKMNGQHAILNNKYQTVGIVRPASHLLASGHEVNVLGGRSVLIEVSTPVPTDLSLIGGDQEQKWVVSSGFQELDLETGELIFEWYSLDHISPNYSDLFLKPTGPWSGRSALDAYHYFALNSIDKDDQGNYLISSRHCSAIFKISGTNGNIIWQLGGRQGSDFQIPSNLEFAYQHHARFRYRSPDGSIERISFLDNANSDAQPHHFTGRVSRIRYIELNHTTKSISEIWTYPAPDDLIAVAQGSLQFLPNGNAFVNWGSAGAITEYSENGTILFHAYLDSYPSEYVHSYRGFRSNWTGISSEEPAVLAFKLQSQGLMMWVSWNGDTETKAWRFYLQDSRSSQKVNVLGTQSRKGFETRFQSNLDQSLEEFQKYFIVAEALNSSGHVIGRSRPVKIQDDKPYRAHIDKLELQSFEKERILSAQERMEL
ncbi:uncharacterized protein N7483_011151 [Penicillium malachiteum]|uniref:uncharacterized protein n=1 Tax=Penicillium malachiteum TaxID=1324776 RepID=UPI0025468248|nr:uncharacterized protein N7483_011151 [Penicillium malachiteum]KAJ5713970.1 hypothetical protein N7483_011151 [Penicillium malachiteum]